MTTSKYVIEKYGETHEIFDVWESFSGWYWFVTNPLPYPEEPDIKYGFVVGFEEEFGTFDLKELLDIMGKSGKVWRVPKQNWFSISHVKRVEA